VIKTVDIKGDCKLKFHTLHDIICNVFFVLIKSLKTKKSNNPSHPESLFEDEYHQGLVQNEYQGYSK
jgi:hypothetical protein